MMILQKRRIQLEDLGRVRLFDMFFDGLRTIFTENLEQLEEQLQELHVIFLRRALSEHRMNGFADCHFERAHGIGDNHSTECRTEDDQDLEGLKHDVQVSARKDVSTEHAEDDDD